MLIYKYGSYPGIPGIWAGWPRYVKTVKLDKLGFKELKKPPAKLRKVAPPDGTLYVHEKGAVVTVTPTSVLIVALDTTENMFSDFGAEYFRKEPGNPRSKDLPLRLAQLLRGPTRPASRQSWIKRFVCGMRTQLFRLKSSASALWRRR